MKKIILGLLAPIIIAVSFMMPAGSADAAQSTWTETHCKSHTSLLTIHIRGCVRVGWRVQDDGTGIRLEDAWAWPTATSYSPHPCRVLTSPAQPKSTFWGSATSGGIMTSIPQFFKPKTECSHHYDLEIKIPYNSNKARFDSEIRWNMKGGWDWIENMGFYICRNNAC